MKYLLTTISPGTLLSQLMTGFIAHYILISDNRIGSSVTTIIQYAHSLPVNKHLILLGVLPIYIAIIIFGSAMISATVGCWLEKKVMKPFKARKTKTTAKPILTTK